VLMLLLDPMSVLVVCGSKRFLSVLELFGR